ncbi:MAG: cryptochrome/photolyase family protein [Flavobacteriaceae bacterium]
MKTALFWFRRDLRLRDNTALNKAIEEGYRILPLFIFDSEICDELPRDDARISFIYTALTKIHEQLSNKYKSQLIIKQGEVLHVINQLILNYQIDAIFCNEDYEPYALSRDLKVKELCQSLGISFKSFVDHVIFRPGDILKKDLKPYTVYTPFKKQWLIKAQHHKFDSYTKIDQAVFKTINEYVFPEIEELGFLLSSIKPPEIRLEQLANYKQTRDFPAQDQTSYVGAHLRFGTISIRELIIKTKAKSETFLSELIWREFFIQILFYFPKVVSGPFKAKYAVIPWQNDKDLFERWKKGETGYPLVDAGMRQLNKTGFMHNRVRMLCASFLCKHLLIDWSWGEAYFAEKLLDFELASNNGNWQWAAGTGCDAAPYFRVFNPHIQLEKFDKELLYVNRWVENFNELSYPHEIVEHKTARLRAIETYKKALNQ